MDSYQISYQQSIAEMDARNAAVEAQIRQAHIDRVAELQRLGLLPRRVTIRFNTLDPEARLYDARQRLAELSPN